MRIIFPRRFIYVVLTCFLLFFHHSYAAIPQPDKLVILVLENHAYSQIVGSSAAPYINNLINDSKTALFTQSYALSHPSQPNYIQLFSGSNQGVTNNNIPANAPFTAPNLGASLINASKTFVGYSEDLPSVGFLGETNASYARKHSPWTHWQGSPINGIPDTLNQPFTAFPTNFNLLPNVSVVIPNLDNCMHDGSDPARITRCDTWIQNNLDAYIQWCKTNNSLFILTFDEDDGFSNQHILTFFTGQKVLHGSYSTPFTHYDLLRTLEDMFNLPYAGASANGNPIDYCWDLCSHSVLVSPPGPIYFCNGDSVTLTSSPGSSYLWSTGETTQSIVVSSSGTYNVITDNGAGCVSTSSDISLTESSFPSSINVLTESMGSVSGTTPIATHESANGFDNDNLTMSGTGDVRPTLPSSNYAGASGGANIFLTNIVNRNFIISNINTTGLSNLELSFGIFKSTIASTGSDLLVQISEDGVNYTTLTFAQLPTGSGSAVWHYRTAAGVIPSTGNLRIQFLQTGTLTQYRIDDVSLKFSSSSPSISAGGPTSFCQGGSVVLTATPANSYYWSTGETSQSITAFTSGNYYVIGTLSTGCLESSNIIEVESGTIVTPTVVISSNIGNSICAGDNVIFTAIPNFGGSAPTYQWQVNGANTGITTTSYFNNSFLDGDVVTCIMTSNISCASVNTVISNPATISLNLNVTPEIYISNTASDTICQGENVIFTATPVFGGSNPFFQWKKNGVNDGLNDMFYSSSSLANGDVITCEMTSSATCANPQTVTSTGTTMFVTPSTVPTLTITPDPGLSICSGTNVTFTANPVNGGNTPYYQWTKNGFNTGNNSTIYTDNALTDGDIISCVMISSAICPSSPFINSNDLTVNVSPVVTPSVSISANTTTTICEGTSVLFTATPVNEGLTPTYQWKKNGSPVGTNAGTYSPATLSNGDVITCELTNNDPCALNPTAISNGITMTVNPVRNPAVTIAANPGSSICSGTNVIFTATPTDGGSTPVYQWKLNGTVVGTNSTTYSSSTLSQGDVISCEMTGSAPCSSPAIGVSNNITMTVNNIVTPSVTISANPGTTICDGTLVTFTATPVNGGASPSFQWKRNSIVVGTNITYSNNFSVNGDVISCRMINNSACTTTSTVFSNNLVMTVAGNVTPTISITSNTGNTICSGTNVTFNASITNGGSAPVYQWKKNGMNVGVNAGFYTNNSLSNNDVISCSLTSNATCPTVNPAISNSITMTVTTTPSIINFSPLSGGPGVGVTINGNNFIGVTAVTFNGVNAAFNVNNSNQIIAYVPPGTSTGTIQISNSCGTGASAATFTVNTTNLLLNLKLFIEGYYISGGQMNPVIDPLVCDTITLELHESTAPYNLAFISKNVINPGGIGTFNFPFSANGNSYYIVAYNHNSLKTWSSTPVLFGAVTNYDFSIAASKSYGNNVKDLGDGNFALYSGDVNHDDVINMDDFNEVLSKTQLFQTGYLVYDLTGDNIIESADFAIIENNRFIIQVQHP